MNRLSLHHGFSDASGKPRSAVLAGSVVAVRKSEELLGPPAGIGGAQRSPNAKDQKGSHAAMNTTLLVCLSQQLAAYQSMDSIANNLANVSTPGFKRETPKFQEYLDQVQPSEGQTGTQSVSFVQQTGMMRDMSEGHIDITNAPFDLAINGQGYFTVQTANGPRYTRNGHFSLDQSGRIVDDAGDPVQGGGGDISIQATDGDIHIAGDGTVSGINGQIGQLSIVDFANDRALVKEGGSLYSTTQTANTALECGRAAGRDRKLEHPAGRRDFQHDRSHAGLSGRHQFEQVAGERRAADDRQARDRPELRRL